MTMTTPSTPAPPKPLPFAVMRNCHEAIRGAIQDCDDGLASGSVSTFGPMFRETTRGISTHGLLEDIGLFPLIDKKFDNEATKNGLQDLHVAESPLEEAVIDAIASEDIEKVTGTYTVWKEHHLEHLKKEEKVMMPRVMDMAKMVGGDPARMGELLNKEVLGPAFDEDPQEMAWFVRWNARMLAKHGSVQHDGFTAMRVWVWGFQWACTPNQWDAVLPGLRSELMRDHPDYYERLCTEFDIESPGKVRVEETSPFFWVCCWKVPIRVEEEEKEEKKQASKDPPSDAPLAKPSEAAAKSTAATEEGPKARTVEPKVVATQAPPPSPEKPVPSRSPPPPLLSPTTTVSTQPHSPSVEVEV